MSSTVHVLVGQCGNQLGASFLNALSHEAGAGDFLTEEEEAEEQRLYMGEKYFRRYGSSASPLPRKTTKRMTAAAYHHRVSRAHFRRPLRSLPPCASSRRDWDTCERGEASSTSSFGRGKHFLPEPRCVLVDMEPQVVSGLLRRGGGEPWIDGITQEEAYPVRCSISSPGDGAWSRETMKEEQGGAGSDRTPATVSLGSPPLFQYAAQQCATRYEGSGNNWAYGYLHQGESRREAIEDCLAREMEVQDTVIHTFHVLHSLAGGTGSGVGSLVGEVVKDMQPHCCTLLHSVVWPFTSGEVVTQWYNLCCAVSSLKENADGIQVLFNDWMLDHCEGVCYPAAEGKDMASPLSSATSSPFSRLQNFDTTAIRHPRRIGKEWKERISYATLNASLTHTMLPLHLPQYLCAVPTPQRDLRQNRVPTLQRLRSEGDGDGRRGAETGAAVPLRYARTEDVLEAVGAAWDPAMKFFTASSLPFSSCSPPEGAEEGHAGYGSQRHTAATTWLGILTEAVRTAEARYGAQPLPQPYSSLSVSSSLISPHCGSLCPLYTPRSCLWCLRGPEAMTEGIRTLQDVLARTRVEGTSQPQVGSRTTEWGRVACHAPHSSAAHASPPLSSLFIHPRPFVFSGAGSPVTTATTSSLSSSSVGVEDRTPPGHAVSGKDILPYAPPPYQIHLYGPSPQIGFQAEYAARRAEELLQVNAFVHHYTKYGLEKSFLMDAVATTYEMAGIYLQ